MLGTVSRYERWSGGKRTKQQLNQNRNTVYDCISSELIDIYVLFNVTQKSQVMSIMSCGTHSDGKTRWTALRSIIDILTLQFYKVITQWNTRCARYNQFFFGLKHMFENLFWCFLHRKKWNKPKPMLYTKYYKFYSSLSSAISLNIFVIYWL